jgi:glycosyltransferase involved in cell wall biosynthesis
MKSLPPVFCIDSVGWKTPWWIDRHYLMLGLASRGWPILYSGGPLSLWTSNRDHSDKPPLLGTIETWSSEEGAEILLDRPGWGLPSWPKFSQYDTFVWRSHAKRVLRSFPRPSLERAIAFLCAPHYADYGTYLNLPHTIYHIHDAYWMRGNWGEKAQRAHEALAERADWIFALSDTMLRNLPHSAAGKASVLPQAVYAKEYIERASEPCPEDIRAIPQPRIGYMGRISRKVDLDLVWEIARERPEWHWVLVGAVGVGFQADKQDHASLNKISGLPNVHILGARPQKLMPAYMAHMDVNTMCYRSAGGQWEAGNPLKMFEYLAVGKPVIGTGLENVRRFSHVVDIPESKEEWIAAIERALHQGGVSTIEERRAVALENTWEKVVDQLERKLLEIIQR